MVTMVTMFLPLAGEKRSFGYTGENNVTNVTIVTRGHFVTRSTAQRLRRAREKHARLAASVRAGEAAFAELRTLGVPDSVLDLAADALSATRAQAHVAHRLVLELAKEAT